MNVSDRSKTWQPSPRVSPPWAAFSLGVRTVAALVALAAGGAALGYAVDPEDE
jgi:hypothetical protein